MNVGKQDGSSFIISMVLWCRYHFFIVVILLAYCDEKKKLIKKPFLVKSGRKNYAEKKLKH
jgi:hypothetical protein